MTAKPKRQAVNLAKVSHRANAPAAAICARDSDADRAWHSHKPDQIACVHGQDGRSVTLDVLVVRELSL